MHFYESQRWMWVDRCVRDVPRALRTVRRHGRLNALVVLTLPLGIGVNLAMFSVMRGVLLAPLPYADADRLVVIWQTDRAAGTTREPASIPDHGDIDARATALETTAALRGTDRTIVGVVADEKIHGLSQPTPPMAYAPFGQLPLADTVLVRVQGDPTAVVRDVRRAFREVDPGLAIFGVEPLSRTLTTSLSRERFTMLLLGLFAGLTLLLATLGLYGVLSYSVTQRTTEIGVRMALGARPSGIIRMVMRQAARLLFIGVLVGALGALVFGRVIASLLFSVGNHDGWTLAAAVLVMSVTSLAAAYVPAPRASRLAPALALTGT